MTTITYLLRSYPRSSQTFVLNEIRSLEKRGMDVAVVALARASDSIHQPVADEIAAPVTYLGETTRRQRVAEVLRALGRRPARLASLAISVARARGVDRGYTAVGRMSCLLYAVQLANLLQDGEVEAHVHAHFAHDPAYVAMLAHRLTGVTFSFTGHARDLYQVESELLSERVEGAVFVTTVTDYNRRFIDRASPGSMTPVHVIPQGTDTSTFAPDERLTSSDPIAILAIGRLVPKKGFELLVDACRIMADAELEFTCTIIGEGPGAVALQRRIADHDLSQVVTISPPMVQAALPDEYRKCDIFVLPAIVTPDGDSDALPTVLLEAMSCGRPVVTTPVGGIAELVSDGVNGRLVESGDVAALTEAMTTLATDHGTRGQMGRAARATVVDRFDHSANVAALADLMVSASPHLETAAHRSRPTTGDRTLMTMRTHRQRPATMIRRPR